MSLALFAIPTISKERFSIFSFSNVDFSAKTNLARVDIDSEQFVSLISNKIDNAAHADHENFPYAVGDYLRLPKLYNAEGFDTEKLSNETMRNRSGYLYPQSLVHKYYKQAAIRAPNIEATINSKILSSAVEEHLAGLSDNLSLRKIFEVCTQNF